jgi:hypothetical protein
MKEVTETAMTWDHDTGKITISTRRRAIINKLRGFGCEEIYSDDAPNGYTTFCTDQSVLTVGFRRKQKRNLSENQLKAMQEGRRRAQA